MIAAAPRPPPPPPGPPRPPGPPPPPGPPRRPPRPPGPPGPRLLQVRKRWMPSLHAVVEGPGRIPGPAPGPREAVIRSGRTTGSDWPTCLPLSLSRTTRRVFGLSFIATSTARRWPINASGFPGSAKVQASVPVLRSIASTFPSAPVRYAVLPSGLAIPQTRSPERRALFPRGRQRGSPGGRHDESSGEPQYDAQEAHGCDFPPVNRSRSGRRAEPRKGPGDDAATHLAACAIGSPGRLIPVASKVGSIRHGLVCGTLVINPDGSGPRPNARLQGEL